MPSKINIDPPLLNAACPWSTTLEDIKALYDSPYTGAVTIRTSLLEGFSHDDSIHQFIFFEPGKTIPQGTPVGDVSARVPTTTTSTSSPENSSTTTTPISSVNTLGYSPLTLSEYLGIINEIVGQRHLGTDTPTKKPFILSVTGTPDEIAMAYALVANAAEMDEDLRLNLEINLSCPNIHGAPPPAYDPVQLTQYLEAISDSKSTYRGRMASPDSVPRVGIKLPPYTYTTQFTVLANLLVAAKSSEPGEGCVVDFITATNTLGGNLLLDSDNKPVLNSEAGNGIGGLAGAALHPLAVGNVAQLRRVLELHPDTRDIAIIGVGGVSDKAAADRFKAVGAHAVGVATALGRYGLDVFEKITKGT
ncbi:hypothetical protein PV10_08308 [Exophiala mesophila]|uniref:Dihydroorotate oxidase n=1 Tax=Exophiala mesophila TaxID=212818 RepID=A0A0D1Z413_EXOME|nr:uncharacterized protein PV10_08308 [Exophiala mesophila]KIV88644.1 hypothetical protein PV10_08308 [Exophiala mesophila]